MKKNFEEWAEEWLSYKKDYVKESTYANYSIAMINHIVPAFRGVQMNDITTAKIQRVVLMWSKSGKINKNGGLALKTIKDMTIILKTCIRDFGNHYDSDIILKSIEYPKSEMVGRREVLSKVQQENMIDAIRNNPNYETLGYMVVIYTGIRIGELCALKWEDIDMNNRVVKISKTLQRIYMKSETTVGKTKIVITSPKSEKSIRDIPISNILYHMLEKIRPESEKIYFLTGTSRYIEPRLYRKHYENFLLENQLQRIHFHGLRHTFATRCIEAGADYKVVSELLGHSSVNLTLNLYVHPQMEDKRKCVELL